MKRFASDYLRQWKTKLNRKPLIIRGARQVGKTRLVRMFADEAFENLVEINFDETPSKRSLFQSEDIQEILRLVEIDLDCAITPGTTLLFLDEIQAAPELTAKFRYFHEKLPSLHIVCAGSLFDFVLADHQFSMPVGRVEYMFLGLMSFEEFLLANDAGRLHSYINGYDLFNTIPEPIHEKLQGQLKEYLVLGGMPGVLKAYFSSGKDFRAAGQEQQSILQTCHEEFAKYKERANVALLQRVYNDLPAHIGNTIKYAAIDRETKAAGIRKALEMLEKARLIYRVSHSFGNGIPLRAEKNESRFKILFLDIGLLNASWGLKLTDFVYMKDYISVKSGAAAEQFIGQHLLYRGAPYETPELFFWNRHKKGASSEVDYPIQEHAAVVPVEVKSGKTGSLKSLHMFVNEKSFSGIPITTRFNADTPSIVRAKTSIATKEPKDFALLSLPAYLVEQFSRLLKQAMEEVR